jgi:hypothetical protein
MPQFSAQFLPSIPQAREEATERVALEKIVDALREDVCS